MSELPPKILIVRTGAIGDVVNALVVANAIKEARPEVIDRVVDPGFLGDLDPVNSNRPQLNLDDTGYFLHGLNLGLTTRF